jgi:hypothetical protein
MSTTSEKLKLIAECPICGTFDGIYQLISPFHIPEKFHVGCNQCNIEIIAPTEDLALKVWNHNLVNMEHTEFPMPRLDAEHQTLRGNP